MGDYTKIQSQNTLSKTSPDKEISCLTSRNLKQSKPDLLHFKKARLSTGSKGSPTKK